MRGSVCFRKPTCEVIAGNLSVPKCYRLAYLDICCSANAVLDSVRPLTRGAALALAPQSIRLYALGEEAPSPSTSESGTSASCSQKVAVLRRAGELSSEPMRLKCLRNEARLKLRQLRGDEPAYASIADCAASAVGSTLARSVVLSPGRDARCVGATSAAPARKASADEINASTAHRKSAGRSLAIIVCTKTSGGVSLVEAGVAVVFAVTARRPLVQASHKSLSLKPATTDATLRPLKQPGKVRMW